MLDPGTGQTITIERTLAYVPLTSVGVETRTLARPTRVGAVATLAMKADGGDITVTITGGYDETGDTTFVFSDPGQFLMLISLYDGTNYFWRKISDYGLGNQTPAVSAAVLAGGANTVSTPVAGVGAGYRIARGVTALDGSNPTPVVTGLTTVVAATVTLEGSSAPGVGTSVLTIASTNYATGALAVYAWKPTSNADPTLVASTGTENFEWIAVGT